MEIDLINFNKNITKVTKETIKSLQVDKDNLVKDNITLIKDNQSLKIMMNQKNQ